MNKTVLNYRKQCGKLVKEFMETYYEGEDYYFIGSQHGLGVFTPEGGDEFWNLDTAECALMYEIPEKILFNWYHNIYINEEAEVKYNLYTYFNLKNVK